MSLVPCESHFKSIRCLWAHTVNRGGAEGGIRVHSADKTSLLWSIDLLRSFWKLSEEQAFGVRLAGLKAKVIAELGIGVEEVVATRDGLASLA